MATVRTLIGNIKGPKGDTGAAGATGPQGPGATIEVGTVSTTAYGNPVQITNSGTETDAVLDFVIPQGKPGEQTTKMSLLTLDTITTQTAEYPVPAVGDVGSTAWGKIVKFFNDIKTAVTGKVDTTSIVNNLTSTSTDKPLSAAQGKALNDAIASVNNDKQDALVLVALNSNNGVFENGGYLKIGRLVLFDLTFTCQTSTTGTALISGFPASSQNNKPFYGQQITDSPSSNFLSFRIYGGNLYPNLSIGAGRYHCYGTYISAS